MKRGYVILVLLIVFCTSCEHWPVLGHKDSCSIVAKGAKLYDLCIDQKMISKPHDTILGHGNYRYSIIDVRLWIRNNSNDSLKYMNMTCDTEIIFTIDNKNIDFLQHNCSANFAFYFVIGAHGMKESNLHLTVNRDSLSKNNKFKIAMHLVKVGNENPLDHFFIENGQISFGPGDTIYSNPV